VTETNIANIDAWEILDSRGRPTVACSVTLEDGSRGMASVPSGASTGRHEARELRDGAERYGGLGVLQAVHHVRHELAAAVLGRPADDQRSLDEALRREDGTPSLARLGANAVLAVSVATAHALAASRRQPLWQIIGPDPLLPLPMINIISGGAHAGGLIDVQDLLVVPLGASTFGEALEWAARVRLSTARAAESMGIATSLIADEGGIAGRLASNRAALELLARGVEASGLAPGEDVGIAIDVAATQLMTGDGRYELKTEQRVLDSAELVDEMRSWCSAFPIVSVEDVLGEDDWDGWLYASEQLRGIQLLGDDLFVTQLDRLEHGIDRGIANAVLVKANQNGTLTGALDVVSQARTADYATVVSARSGETEDNWLADLAVGCRAGQIKVGSTMRSERTAKWNRLLQIEHELGEGTDRYAGRRVFVDKIK
jgi:enolase